MEWYREQTRILKKIRIDMRVEFPGHYKRIRTNNALVNAIRKSVLSLKELSKAISKLS